MNGLTSFGITGIYINNIHWLGIPKCVLDEKSCMKDSNCGSVSGTQLDSPVGIAVGVIENRDEIFIVRASMGASLVGKAADTPT